MHMNVYKINKLTFKSLKQNEQTSGQLYGQRTVSNGERSRQEIQFVLQIQGFINAVKVKQFSTSL